MRSKPKINRVIKWAAAAGYAVMLCLGSLIPLRTFTNPIGAIFPSWDLLAHAVAYACLSLLLCSALTTRARNACWAAGAAAALSMAYAGALELAQAFTSWRVAALSDLFANAVGILLSSSIWIIRHQTVASDRTSRGQTDSGEGQETRCPV